MPETVHDKKVFSLLEVTQSIQRTLAGRYTSAFWVKAEMNKLHHYPHSGHCYPELVEKRNGKVVAQIKATLWKDDYLRIDQNFLQVLREPLKDGITILFYARITFSPMHGLALGIIDIDPVFSLGELEREKQETVEKLKAEGIYSRNKEQALPRLPQRIAIISVQTSKGYADFLKVIEGNEWGYRFFHLLFPSLLQGDNAVESICHQLKRIRKVIAHFDVVAIIRGGGGDVGLSCFNNLQLSREIALFPIPVITGIGHSTNETVVEMIAFKNAITPTELADYLLQKFHNFSVPVQNADEKLRDKTRRLLKDEKLRFHNATKYFRSVAGNIVIKHNNSLEGHFKTLFQRSVFLLKSQKEAHLSIIHTLRRGVLSFCHGRKQDIRHVALNMKKDVISILDRTKMVVYQHNDRMSRNADALVLSGKRMVGQAEKNLADIATRHTGRERTSLASLERIIHSMDPENVLKRGYTITLVNGKAAKSAEQVKKGDTITTVLHDGRIISEAKSINKPEAK